MGEVPVIAEVLAISKGVHGMNLEDAIMALKTEGQPSISVADLIDVMERCQDDLDDLSRTITELRRDLAIAIDAQGLQLSRAALKQEGE